MQAQAKTLKDDAMLLGFIYQNARMGITGINQIRSSVDDDKFMELINRQYSKYDEFVTKSAEELRSLGEKPEDISPMAKVGSFLSSKYNTAVDSSTSHIAEMMIQGTEMGVTKLLQKLNSISDCSNKYRKFAQELIDYETKSVEDLKAFL
mgnify:FL=1|jgi:hypothetical protein